MFELASKTFVRALAAATAYYLVPVVATAVAGRVHPPIKNSLQKLHRFWLGRRVYVDENGEILK